MACLAMNGSLSSQPIGGPGADVPKVETKLFVGRLPRHVTEAELEPLFSQYGTVVDTIIIRDKGSGQHKGSAFIKMASLTNADSAIRGLNNLKVVDEKLGPIQVKYATGEAERLGLPAEQANPGIDVGKLFVGSLPRGVTESQVKEIFEPYGAIEEIVLMKDNATGQTKGCAFVKFAYKECAMYAIKSVSGIHRCTGCPRALEVKFSETRRIAQTGKSPLNGNLPLHIAGTSSHAATGYGIPIVPARAPASVATPPPSNLNPRSSGGWTEYFTGDGRPYYHNEALKITQWTKPSEFDRVFPPNPPPSIAIGATSAGTTGPPGGNVFVFHLPPEWTQTEVIQNFSPYGRVVSCFIATDHSTGRNKGYGFVSYDSVEAAANAVLGMNGFLIGSKRLKVSIKTGEESYVAHLLSPQAQAAAIQAGQLGTLNNGANAAPSSTSAYGPTAAVANYSGNYRATPY